MTFFELFMSHPVPMWMYDQHTFTFVEVNEATVAHYGYTREELVGSSILFIRPEYEIERLKAYLSTARPPRRKSGIWKHRRKDGSMLDVDITTYDVEHDGQTLVLVMAMDVTERLAHENRLKTAVEQLERAERRAGLGSWTMDSQGRFFLSKQAMRLLGISEDTEHITLDVVLDHIHPDDRADVLQRYERLVQGELPTGSTFRTNPEYGPLRFIKSTIYPPGSDSNTDFEGSLADVTELRQAEQLLSLQGAALHHAANAIVIVNRHGIIEWVNPAFTALTGYTSQEAIGQNPRILRSGVQDAAFFETMWSTLLRGEVWRGDLVNRKKDGTHYHERQTITPVTNQRGEIEHFVSIKEDVTESIRSEERLRANREFLRLMIEAQPNCIKVLSEDACLMDINAAGLAMIEANALSEVLGLPVRDLIQPSDREAFDEMHARIVSGERAEASFDLTTLKGSVRSVESHGVPLRDASGRVTGHLAVTRDVTAQKRLLALNAQFTVVLEGIARGTPLEDTMNSLCLAIEQYEPATRATILEVLKDDTVRHLAAPTFSDVYVRTLDGLSIGPKAGSCGTAAYEDRLVIVEDTLTSPLWAHFADFAREHNVLACWSKPIHGRLGDVVGVVGLHYAVPRAPRQDEIEIIETVAHIAGIAMQRHESEQSLLAANDELERRVGARTRELQDAIQELEAFTYSVSHDLNAPLRVVAGFAQMLLEDHGDKLDEDGRKLVDVIVKRTRNMGELIRDLLTLSRAATADLSVAQVDMTQLAQSSVNQQLESGATGVEVVLGDLPKATGDALLLKQVWVNLVGNAFKFSAKTPTPRIEIGGEERASEMAYWVKDNGAGYDPQYQDMLFKVFWRGHTQSEFEGNGAGLAIVERIVRRHGGRVWADGKPGEGATFGFTLPKSCQ